MIIRKAKAEDVTAFGDFYENSPHSENRISDYGFIACEDGRYAGCAILNEKGEELQVSFRAMVGYDRDYVSAALIEFIIPKAVKHEYASICVNDSGILYGECFKDVCKKSAILIK